MKLSSTNGVICEFYASPRYEWHDNQSVNMMSYQLLLRTFRHNVPPLCNRRIHKGSRTIMTMFLFFPFSLSLSFHRIVSRFNNGFSLKSRNRVTTIKHRKRSTRYILTRFAPGLIDIHARNTHRTNFLKTLSRRASSTPYRKILGTFSRIPDLSFSDCFATRQKACCDRQCVCRDREASPPRRFPVFYSSWFVIRLYPIRAYC